MQKYEFTGETKKFAGVILRKIRAVRGFGDINAGDVGGWIEDEQNLSHYGNCWVSDNAKVYDNAKISDNARVFDDACVFDNAEVFGDAKVYDNAKISDNACVFEDACVFDKAGVFGDAEVSGNAYVGSHAIVSGNAKVKGRAELFNRRHICVLGPIGSRNGYTTFFRGSDDKIYVSCDFGFFLGDIDEFLSAVEKTHGNNEYAQEYRLAVELAKTVIKLEGDKVDERS